MRTWEEILQSQDKRFFIKLNKEAKLKKRRPYIGKDGKPIKPKGGRK
jgi:hypothetical protein